MKALPMMGWSIRAQGGPLAPRGAHEGAAKQGPAHEGPCGPMRALPMRAWPIRARPITDQGGPSGPIMA